jgi:hypothetical protein
MSTPIEIEARQRIEERVRRAARRHHSPYTRRHLFGWRKPANGVEN